MPLKTGDHLGARVLISPHHLTQFFRVKLAGDGSRIHQVTEEDSELAAFGFCWYRDFLRSWSLFHNRLRRSLVGLAGCFLEVFGYTRPRESSFICLYLRFMDIQEFIFQIVEVVVIEVKASFQRTVGDTSLTFEQFECLGEDFIEGHGHPSRCRCGARRWCGNWQGHSDDLY